MGVRTCSRKACTNIMCDRHSIEYGYICHQCFKEMTDKGVTTHKQIKEFMETPKFVQDYHVDLDKEFQLKR